MPCKLTLNPIPLLANPCCNRVVASRNRCSPAPWVRLCDDEISSKNNRWVSRGVAAWRAHTAGRAATDRRSDWPSAGWREGGDLHIELRWGDSDAARIGTFAKELVNATRRDLRCYHPVIGALANETRRIPIVFALVPDAIGRRFCCEHRASEWQHHRLCESRPCTGR